MLRKEEKTAVIEANKTHATDTGFRATIEKLGIRK